MKPDRKFRIPTMKASGICAVLLGVVLLMLMPSQVKITGQSGITSRTTPLLLSYIMILCGIGLFLKGSIGKREDYKEVIIGDEVCKLIFIVMLIAYVFAIDYIGFMSASLIFTMALLWFTGERKKSRYLVVAAGVVIIYMAFRFLLKVDFGSLWGI